MFFATGAIVGLLGLCKSRFISQHCPVDFGQPRRFQKEHRVLHTLKDGGFTAIDDIILKKREAHIKRKCRARRETEFFQPTCEGGKDKGGLRCTPCQEGQTRFLLHNFLI